MPKSDKKDAERWRFTQKKGYFYCGPSYDTFTCSYAVGLQPEGATVSGSILGRGPTLKDAIDKAIAKLKKLEKKG